ncbi:MULTISPECIES: hypothetical protein [unclassified Rhizobacter]|uniref:hypothetical protein n=1 Tax=unclassified Rhizobacter TaxID=2640088 RepID=UPI0006F4F461|nr:MULTISPECIES: hypothetical protein [unclassified Rhizobacter]KQU73429.1 hypothetical protein ASC88_04235 [Rhizobacter sp. Root29]KQV98614.1 hypothetical protein ASC98_08065 [Rhizobacter sp. Root1238]KRB04867.1 hypothetical protein ASE08_13220 [Rhizobacter sp. Root16D2]
MTTTVLLPTCLAGLRPEAFSLIEADPADVIALCRSLWEAAVRDGWVAWHQLPCRFDMSAVDRYAGRVQFGVLASSASRPGQTCLWSAEADRADGLLTMIAIRLRCRVISTALCHDWQDADAVGELVVRQGAAATRPRIVRVMRNDHGRLDYFEAGEPLDFEQPAHYAKRLLKHRVSEDVLMSYWHELGVDVAAERADWSGRGGIAYVRANSVPIAAGAALQAA